MSQNLILLSLLPILSIMLSRISNSTKTLNYIVPITLYSIILLALFLNTDSSQLTISFLNINGNQINILFNFIQEYTLMSKVVLFVSGLVLYYSSKFIESEDKRAHARYFLFLTIFISSMFLFTLSNDLFSSFIFWEILGLSSYFLIGFWNKDSEAIRSSTIAFWITRFGDLFFLAGIILIFTISGTLSIDSINTGVESKKYNINLPLLLIIIGVFSKSAQFPFNIWLPKAMKGPTPVSSLIHSATMVVAGVLLLFKLYPSISYNELALNFLIIIGIISCVGGAIVAFFEEDLKKILAYSTISHIGLMFLAIGIKKPDLAYFHMFSHSFFKSLLFLYAGAVITLVGTSKLELLKGSIKLKSTMGFVLIIACCSLSSIYFFTGSFSKEYIIFSLINKELYIASSAMLIGIIFTCLYSARIFFGLIDFNLSNDSEHKINSKFLIPLVLLALLSLAGPFTMSLFQDSIYIAKVPHSIGGILTLQALTIFIFYFYNIKKLDIVTSLNQFKVSSADLFKIDSIYTEIYEKVFKSTSEFIAWFDRNIIDGLINYVPFKIIYYSKKLMKIQDGQAKSYAVTAVVFFIVLILAMTIIDNFLIIGELK